MARVEPYTLPLTEDEHTAIKYLAQGHTRDQAAHRMDLPAGTVVSMLRRVYSKTGTNGATHAVAVLMARGVLAPHDILPDPERQWGGPASDTVYVMIHTELDPDKLPGLGDAYKALMRKGL